MNHCGESDRQDIPSEAYRHFAELWTVVIGMVFEVGALYRLRHPSCGNH